MTSGAGAAIGSLDAARHFGLFGAFVGLLAGIAYAFGGLVIDATTTGLNMGTALAFGALVGMPALFAVFGAAAGALWAPVCRRIPQRLGGCAKAQTDDPAGPARD